MNRHGNRGRLGGVLLAVCLGALALLALPTLGIGKHDDRGHRAAGKVESFDRETGLLVVDLAKGRKIAGLVVRRTRIRCGPAGRRHRRARHRGTLSRRDVGSDRPAPGPDRPTDVVAPERDGEGREVDQPESEALSPGESDDPGNGAERRRPRRCIKALVPGAVVIRAEMVLAHGEAFFSRIGMLLPWATDQEPETEEGSSD
jgi:hypothetical protein